jgi:tetratricopeptide (TPR) repeat protein
LVLLLSVLVAGTGAELLAQAVPPLDRAEALLRQGRPGDAEEVLRQVLATQPSGRGHYLLGFALVSQYRYSEAEAALRRAVAENPRAVGWLHALAKALLEQGKNRAAIDTLDRALAVEERANLHFARAMCRLNIGEPEPAKRDLEAALALQPADAEARFKLGELTFDAGDFAAAREHLALALGANPNHLEARFLLGLAEQRLGNPQAAAEALAAVLQEVPGHVGALLNLGRLQIAAGRADEGRRTLERFRATSVVQDEIDFLTRANEKNPGNVEGRLALAAKLLEIGRSAEALDEALAARVLAPRRPGIYRLLAEIFGRLGREDDARRSADFANRLEREG